MVDWTHFMIHCSGTPPTMNVTREDIERWHLHEKGWSRVGYSMLVERDGNLDILIPFDRDDVIESWEISNGARGWNGRTKHMCLAGGRAKDGNYAEYNFTSEQEATLQSICKFIVMQYPQIKLIGHNQVDPVKYCPSMDVRKYAKVIGIPDENVDWHLYTDNPYFK